MMLEQKKNIPAVSEESDENALAMLQDAGRMMLALWNNPKAFDPCEISVLGVIQCRLWVSGGARVQVSRAEMMAEADLSQGSVVKAVKRLVAKGVIQRHDMGHRQPFAYSIDQDEIERLAA